MQDAFATISNKGHVTIPVSIRKSLGLSTGDRVAFVVEGGEAKIKRVDSALDRSFGAVKPRTRPEDFADLERQAEQYMAEDALRPVD